MKKYLIPTALLLVTALSSCTKTIDDGPFRQRTFAARTACRRTDGNRHHRPRRQPGHRNGLYPRNSRLRLRPGSRQGNRRLGGRQRQRRERRRAQFQQPRTPGAHHRDLPVGTQARLVDLPRNLRSVLPRHMAHRRCQAGVQPAGQRRRRRSLDDAAQQRRIRHLRTSRIRRPGDDHARRDLRQRTHRERSSIRPATTGRTAISGVSTRLTASKPRWT